MTGVARRRGSLGFAIVTLVMVATCTLTHAVPGAAGRVAAALNLTSAGAFDIGAACAGFTYGLALAADTVRGGTADHVLVIGSEKFSDIIDPEDRSTAFLFGDGAGAGVVSLAAEDGIARPVWCHDGSQADILCVPGQVPHMMTFPQPSLRVKSAGPTVRSIPRSRSQRSAAASSAASASGSCSTSRKPNQPQRAPWKAL